MLSIINKKVILLITSLVCCMISVNTMATNHKLTRANYEQIYKLRLKWTLQDTYKAFWKLKTTKQNISDEIEKLKKEKFLSYHANKTFNAVYSRPQPFTGKPILGARSIWNATELGRVIIAYGLLPVTLPLATAYVTTEWLSKKNNDNKIAELGKTLQKTEVEIANIQPKITELEIESKELKGLENFIAAYSKNPTTWATSPNPIHQ